MESKIELGSDYNLSLSDLTVKENNIFGYLSGFAHLEVFDSGRSALKHISKQLPQENEVLLPEFICESVTNCFKRDKVRFYRINTDFTINIEDLKSKLDDNTCAIFLMHYFGSVQPDSILSEVKEIADNKGIIIIEDTTHSIFSKEETIGDYQACSIRKWLPIPRGGLLYANSDKQGVFKDIRYSKSTDNERAVGMILKDLFLKGKMDCNADYRQIFTSCEERIDEQEEILLMSDLSKYILSCFDIYELIEIRKKNYAYLNEAMRELHLDPAVTMRQDECPLVLPLNIDDRDRFRRYLMDNRVYCAVHWPFDGIQKEDRTFAEACSQHLISLPIDQRYGEKEMSYLADVTAKYGE